MAGYMTKYLAKGTDYRVVCSRGWVFFGFRTVWKNLCSSWWRMNNFHVLNGALMGPASKTLVEFDWVLNRWNRLLDGKSAHYNGGIYEVHDSRLYEI